MQISSMAYWAGAAVALSPTIVHISELVVGYSWSHYVVLAPFLLAFCLFAERGQPNAKPHTAAAAIVIVIAMVVQLLGIATDSWSIARIAFPLTVMGVALLLGRPPLLTMALCFWSVPVPNFLITIATPWSESILAQGAVAVASVLGIEAAASGPLIKSGDTMLRLQSMQGGVVTALVLAELGWYSAVRGGARSWRTALGRSALYASAVIVVQPAAILIAVLVFANFGPVPAEIWMSHGCLMSAAVVFVV
jgi:hypothetical protein